MKLGLYTAVLAGLPLVEVVKKCRSLGLDAVELTTAGYPKKAHFDMQALLRDASEARRMKAVVEDGGLFISALGCSGNHVHPSENVRKPFQSLFRDTILLAEKLGIERVITFSGCPGDSAGSLYPNWVTCPWPEDYLKILDYQWNAVLLPYWTETAKFARDHGVNKICLEMHPGFCVYNPETFLKLRAAAGDVLGLNFDPSHLFWQGIDPTEALLGLGGCIYHFHAKDTAVNARAVRVNGVLDAKHYGDVANRAWTFRTVGYGHSLETWRGIASALRVIGYDYVMSVEHEDCLMSREEGLAKAISFLRQVVLENPPDKMWWA